MKKMKKEKDNDITDYEELYSEGALSTKLSRFAKKAGKQIVFYVLLLYHTLISSDSLLNKAVVMGALGYFILPMDIIFDFIPFTGFTDDLAILTFAVSQILSDLTPTIKKNAFKDLRNIFPNVTKKECEEMINKL